MFDSTNESCVNQIPDERKLKEEYQAIELSRKDPRQFELVYSRHFEAIYRYVKSATQNKEIAADLSQDVFFLAIKNLHLYNHTEAGIRPWLFGIANNQLRMYFRKYGRVMYLPIDMIKLDAFYDGNQQIEANERKKLVSQVLSTLSEIEQEFVQLRCVAELPFSEIALSMNIREEACKMRFYRLLEKIKLKLKHYIQA